MVGAAWKPTGVRSGNGEGMASARGAAAWRIDLDAVAWNAWESGARQGFVAATPCARCIRSFDIDDQGVRRLTTDTVAKAADATSGVGSLNAGANQDQDSALDAILGDAL
ncbi:MAG: hypothetical protein ACLT98_07695 [Eggerthellaceae bacterium]